MGTQLPRPNKGQSLTPIFGPCPLGCGQTAGWITMPLGEEVGLIPGDIVLDGDPAPPKIRAQQLPLFGPCLL